MSSFLLPFSLVCLLPRIARCSLLASSVLTSLLIHSPPHLSSHSLSPHLLSHSLSSSSPLLLISSLIHSPRLSSPFSLSSSSSPSSSYSLSRSNKAIACLYSAVFPLFPSSTTDTRYHLQALRHLYVLAAEPRVLVTRDVETGQATSVEVCVRGEREIKGRTPCIVPEWSSINEVGEEVTRESGDDHVT